MQKNRTFTRLVDFGEAFLMRARGASPKFTTGFTLVETLVAIAIFTMAIVAMMSVLASGLSNTSYAKRKVTAAYLAQEGIEYVRNQRDTQVLFSGTAQASWDAFVAVFPTTEDLNYYPTSSDFSDYTRSIWKIDIPSPPDNEIHEIKVFSKVQNGNYEVTFSENLFNWIE